MNTKLAALFNLDGYLCGFLAGATGHFADDYDEWTIPDAPDRYSGPQRREWKRGWVTGNFHACFADDEPDPAAITILNQLIAEVDE
jgi:hypothetical protein